MDLPTHFTFGLAIGFVFFGKPEIALMIGIGTLLPDLDREYWFIPVRLYRDEQIHRAGLHNVFIMGATYLVSPFLSLGVFLHVLQDSFTTVKDRGVEWFYPITRMIKHGNHDQNGKELPTVPKEHIYFYQEDPQGLVENADPELRDPGPNPVPWRRVYGFAQNSHLLDRGFLFGSSTLVLIWITVPFDLTHFYLIQGYLYANTLPWGLGYGWIIVLFIAGQLDRRDKKNGRKLGQLNFVKYPSFAGGITILLTWLYVSSTDIGVNLAAIFGDPLHLIISIISIPIIATIVILWQTRRGGTSLV